MFAKAAAVLVTLSLCWLALAYADVWIGYVGKRQGILEVIKLIWSAAAAAATAAAVSPGCQAVLLREKDRMERLGKLALEMGQPSRAFAEQFTYWRLRTVYSWEEGYRICKELFRQGTPLPWDASGGG